MEFKYCYDASIKYDKKSAMPQIKVDRIGFRDLVLLETNFARFRVDQETGKATYANEWKNWRCRFELVSICRLNESDERVDQEPLPDEDVQVV